MSTKLRSHGKNTVIWILLGMLILGLGGFGVTNFGGNMRAIGSVGETEISVDEFARALQSEMRAVSAQLGQPVTASQARDFGIDRAVQARLFAAAAVDEQARIMGVSVGDEEVRKQILEAAAFQDPTGKFDRETYKLALRQQGQTEADFEAQLRAESARVIVQGAVVGGTPAPKLIVDRYLSYIGERRAVTVAEIGEADLTAPVAAPTEQDLQAWYEANPAAFTRPEIRKITYAWVTPDMIEADVQLDEAALRASYEARLEEFQQPERRLVEQLVYPSREEAEAAKASVESGTKTFADLAQDRGLALADADLGEVTEADLGVAGDAVFALTEPGVVGPIETDLGPALYAMNAILEAKDVPFEDAQEELAGEARMDRARRMIVDNSTTYEDELAGGVTLEEIAKGSDMVLGTIEFSADTKEDIAAYEAFRTAAQAVTVDDFPELKELDDGGVFALRLDSIVAPAVRPFAEVRDQVAAAWQANAVQDALVARAAEVVAALDNGGSFAEEGFTTTQTHELTRGAFIEGLPSGAVEAAYTVSAEGKSTVARGEGRVILVQLTKIIPADLTDDAGKQLSASVTEQLSQGLGQDIFEYYARAAQAEAGITLDSAAANAVISQMQ